MIYYISRNRELFEEYPRGYSFATIEESLEILDKLNIVGFDTETWGLDPHTGKLLLAQFGNKEVQVVVDCESVDIGHYKDYLESDRTFIMHNAKFDLQWLYKHRIVPKKVFDTMLAERLIYLGYRAGYPSISLQACVERYFNQHLDKTVRGEIYKGVTDSVILYGAKDVVYLPELMQKQHEVLKSRDQLPSLDIENAFVRVLAYVEYCGIKLDSKKWLKKMEEDNAQLKEAEAKLNQWLIDYTLENLPHRVIHNFKPKIMPKKDIPFVLIPAKSLFDIDQPEPECIINWSSSKQTIEVFEELGFDLWTRDKKTGENKKTVGIPLIKKQASKSDIAPLYIEHSNISKDVSSFGQTYIDAINPVTGRIHTNFNQLMKTGRLSSGGEGEGSVNLQQVPADNRTRECFIPEKGNLLIDCDYSDQEGNIFAELSQDKKWIEFYNDTNPRDGHGFVAKMCFPEELNGISEIEVKANKPELRQLAKSARFCFNYNGSAQTMAFNTGVLEERAEKIYKNYFKEFSGINSYFKKQKSDMWNKGYILISTVTGMRSYIWDFDKLKAIEARQKEKGFWDLYRKAKASNKALYEIPDAVLYQLIDKYIKGDSIESMEGKYFFNKKSIFINKETALLSVNKYMWKRKSSCENFSCNSPSQGTAAQMTKIAGIKYFNHLEKNDLLFKVLIPNLVHDEILIEAPKDIAEREAAVLSDCMSRSADIFCKSVKIKAEPEIADYWVH